MNTPKKLGFTLIELVVAATIIVLLASIWFYSYTKNIADARDWARKTDIAALSSQLKLYKRQRWAYTFPWSYYEIHNRWQVVAYQWYMDNSVSLSTAEKLPLDPKLEIPYFFSTTRNRQEFQLALSLENAETPYAIVDGDYKSVAKNVLPNIVLAREGSSNFEINNAVWAGSTNRNLFIFHKGNHNLPYDFLTASPVSDGVDFDTILSDASDDYWQNSDYRSCSEIFTAAKWITPSWQTDEYQIINSVWALTNTGCTAS